MRAPLASAIVEAFDDVAAPNVSVSERAAERTGTARLVWSTGRYGDVLLERTPTALRFRIDGKYRRESVLRRLRAVAAVLGVPLVEAAS